MLLKSITSPLIVILFAFSGCRQTCDCTSIMSSELVRNYEVKLTVTDGVNPLPNVRLDIQAGGDWIPPTETDMNGEISLGLDNKDEIDSLLFTHPKFEPTKFNIEFNEGNFLVCIVQLQLKNTN
jgi:hypothetical protein